MAKEATETLEQKLKDFSHDARLEYLRSNSIANYTKTFPYSFTEEEIVEKKSKLSEVDIELEKLGEEKKAEIKNYDDQINPLKKERKALIADLDTKETEIEETVFDIPDFETNKVNTFDPQGNLVDTRSMTPQEMQTDMFKDEGTEEEEEHEEDQKETGE